MPRRTDFGQNWWAQRWIGALENLGWSSRLQRGRSYARSGHVKSIEVAGDEIRARVQGSQATPYRVTLHVKPLKPEEWERVLETLSSQALFAAKLLAGEMPPDIDDAFLAAGVSLFPSSALDLQTGCSCPDWANPCKHVAAVHYVLSEELDRDPFLLFALRGRSKEEVLEALRARRAEATAGTATQLLTSAMEFSEPEAPSLEASLDRFWALGEELAPPLEPPERRRPAAEGVLRLLGQPPFYKEGEVLFSALMAVYDKVPKRARKAVQGGSGVDPSGEPSEDQQRG